jgi:glycosyltransferase involved in cell wall biosynthesis
MSKLSAVVVTLNEEANIVDCLKSVAFADEIVLVDSHSSDSTLELAKRFTDKVYQASFEGYGKLKNYAVSRATGDWVLSIDADERVSPELAGEIKKAIQGMEGCCGYLIPRRTYFLGRWIMHGGWYPGYVLRLFRKDSGAFNDVLVHECVVVKGRVGRMRGEILHYSDRDLKHYLRKLDHFTDLSAEVLYRNHRKVRMSDLILRPPFMFLKMYVLKCGFLDGMQGLVLSLLSSVHVLLKYVKLWEKNRTSQTRA